MKKAYIFLLAIGLASFSNAQDSDLTSSELKTMCKVLFTATDKAIDEDRKDLIALYYNTYQAIRLDHKVTSGCDQYFSEIKKIYFRDIGNWTLGLNFPPKFSEESATGGFIHKDIDTFRKIRAFGLTDDDLEQFVLIKTLLQQNEVDSDLLKMIDSKNLEIMNEKLKKFKLDDREHEKLKSSPNKQIQNEQFKPAIKQ